MLLITCILSGCDYLESIKGIGFKKAHKLVYENGDDVPQILRKIRREGK
jgi:5'-3' exonuclease